MGHGESIEAENTASAFNVGTNDYTIEGWFKERNNGTYSTNQYARLFDLGPNDNISLMRNYPNTGGKKLLLKENATVIITSTNDVFDGNWHFIQVVRTGGYTKLYVDGTEEGSVASTTNINAISKIIVGAWSDYSYGFDGQIADFRFSNIARTASVPTERLTSDSNTKLLVCSKPYLVDESDTATSLVLLKSANGTRDYPDAIAFSPYDYNEYSATDHGGSVYFDGAGDYLLINSPPTLGANDWTFETWYYSASVPLATNNILLSQGPGNNTIVSNFSVSSTGEIWIQTYTTTNVVLYNTAAGIINGGMWNHIVLTHDYDGSSGGTYKIYANGNQVGNVSYTSGYYWNSGGIAGTPLAMAQYRYNTQANNASYFSDWKISNSVTYSSDFIPPTAPLSSSGASLHIKGTDASIIDKAQGANLKLVGNTTGSTTQVKFAGSKSMYFDGTGDYALISKDTANINTLDKDFTIEYWLYDSSPTTWKYIAAKADSTGNTSTSEISFGTGQFSAQTDGKLYYSNNLGAYLAYTNSALSANTWYHIAVVRNNNVFTMYLDGVAQTATTTNSGSVAVINEDLVLGGHQYQVSTLSRLNGYIQDFRITNGLARYTANFTPPTAPLEG